MTAISISREDSPSKGRYIARMDDVGAEAELTFSHANPHLIIAEHTEVPDVMRGAGVGLALMTRLVEDARAEGAKIVPLCSYVNAQRQKHPEWANVFRTYGGVH